MSDESSLRERLASAQAMMAAGGLDRNRGNAEKLRRYWVHGEGAAKIRWGSPGDWSRCVRHLSKYMGVRAKGYCQLRHKEAIGIYTSTHAKKLHGMSAESVEFVTEVTDADMMCPIEEIHARPDENFDPNWSPSPEILIILNEENPEDLEPIQAAGVRNKPLKADPDPADLTPEEIQALKREKQQRDNLKLSPDAKHRYTAETQPRDANGRFRLVLARLKSDLGAAGLERVIEKVEEAENLDHAGDYRAAVDASKNLIEIIDRLDTGALNAKSIENVRESSRQLGEVIANLPFNFTNQAQKIRYSDVPPTMRNLIESMIKKVEAKIGPEDAAEATQQLKEFMTGNNLFSQSDISRQMSRMLRLLT